PSPAVSEIRRRTLLDLHQEKLVPHASGAKFKAHIIFGTRPELIKLVPVIRQFEASSLFETKVINTGQHVELLDNLIERLQVRVDYRCELLRKGQPLASLYATAFEKLNAIVLEEMPDIILVQGDTTSAAAGALVGFL